MKNSWTFTRGVLLGAGLMYIMDPSRGGRRRARVRDKGSRAWRRSSLFLGKAGRDLRNRAREGFAEAVSQLKTGDAPETNERIPTLQGRPRRVERPVWTTWHPSLQLLAAAAGAAAVAYGAQRAIARSRAGGDEGPTEPNYAYLR
jgi:hypothetical protein